MALYVVIVATVLIAVTNYNIQPWGWPMSRAAAWYRYSIWDAHAGVAGKAPAFRSDRPIPKAFFDGDERLLQSARDEYWKQFIARTAFTSSPIPGVSIDVNDLGLIGGISLVLLMMVLVVCLMREHENLYLALYKVRQFARLRDHEHGTSEANLLYHALVMSQVLASPPTLARWQNRGVLRHFGAIYVLPFAAYVWVLVSNFLTLDKAREYVGQTTTVVLMVLQSGIAIALLGLTGLAWLNSKAMAERWNSAFKAINPVRERLPQMARVDWLRVPFRHRFRRAEAKPVVDAGCHARTVTEIVDTFRAKKPDRFWVRISEAVVPDVGDQVTQEQLQDMTRQVCLRGLDAARQWMNENGRKGKPELLAFTTTDNCEKDRFWKVNGTWEFEIRPADEA